MSTWASVEESVRDVPIILNFYIVRPTRFSLVCKRRQEVKYEIPPGLWEQMRTRPHFDQSLRTSHTTPEPCTDLHTYYQTIRGVSSRE